jgi:hypothetical protein
MYSTLIQQFGYILFNTINNAMLILQSKAILLFENEQNRMYMSLI